MLILWMFILDFITKAPEIIKSFLDLIDNAYANPKEVADTYWWSFQQYMCWYGERCDTTPGKIRMGVDLWVKGITHETFANAFNEDGYYLSELGYKVLKETKFAVIPTEDPKIIYIIKDGSPWMIKDVDSLDIPKPVEGEEYDIRDHITEESLSKDDLELCYETDKGYFMLGMRPVITWISSPYELYYLIKNLDEETMDRSMKILEQRRIFSETGDIADYRPMDYEPHMYIRQLRCWVGGLGGFGFTPQVVMMANDYFVNLDSETAQYVQMKKDALEPDFLPDYEANRDAYENDL